uniref:Uncharacterized protein n=1 Tax=viral metagenome TaxID=1070528 RepID=A0A6C0D218_9ZZZZ
MANSEGDVSVLKQTNTGKEYTKSFEIYSVLFHDLFFNLLQVGITLLLFAGIISLSKKDSEELYPTNLHNAFYGNGDCDLGNLTGGETTFCGSDFQVNGKSDDPSFFATKLAGYAKKGGYATSDMFSTLLLWFTYLAFSCEHFTQGMLKSMNNLGKGLDSTNPFIKFIIIVSTISLINNINVNTINPFLTRLLNIFNIRNKIKKNTQNFILEMFNNVVINVCSILLLLFLFFIVPLTVYYIVALCKSLIENLSTQMNVMSVFAIFLSTNTLVLFVQFMLSQFGSDKIRQQTQGKTGEAAASAVLNAGIQDRNKFNAFITSYCLFFIVPIIVSFSQLFKLVQKLVSHMNLFNLGIVYNIIFMTIILISFYYTIQNDLDKTFKFPYSIFYAIIAALAIGWYAKQNKNELTEEFEKKSTK